MWRIKKRLKYIRELRKSTTLEIKNIKNELIKIKNKKINRNKKEIREYYQENKFYGVKDIRNLFDDDDIYEGIKYLFNEKIMHYYFKQNAVEYKIIEHQKVEDINMLKSLKNESDKTKELGLKMKELKAIARKIGVNNYENLSRIRLVEEIDKLEQSKESKKKLTVSSLLLKGKNVLDLSQEKVKRKITKKEALEVNLKKTKQKQETVDKLYIKILANLKKMFTNQKRFIVHLMIVMLNIKVMVIEINQYQLLDILIILENI